MRKLAAIALTAMLALCGCSNAGNAIKRESQGEEPDTSARFVSDFEVDNFTTVTDNQTGIVYLVWTRYEGTKLGIGGITPLLDSDGKPVTLEEE